MIETSVVETIAGRIEQELARVRAARPTLSSRISCAEGILVTHLSCRRQRVIRVRVSGGHTRFLVASQGPKGAVYVVDPASWECSCPDAHRRGKGCKHALACWALWRASVRPAVTGGLEHVGEIVGRAIPLRPCASCGDRFPARELVEVGPREAEWDAAVSEGDALCCPCARRPLTRQRLPGLGHERQGERAASARVALAIVVSCCKMQEAREISDVASKA